MSTKHLNPDIAIVGSGLVGPAFALAAAKEGLSSIILDQAPLEAMMADGFDGRAYAFALSSRRFMQHIGIWSDLVPHAGEINDILVSDGEPGQPASPFFTHFDRREIGPEGFGHMIEDRYLRQALLRAVEAEPLIQAFGNVHITQCDPKAMGGGKVILNDGRVITAHVIIGADGRRSQVAQAIGADILRIGYNQIGLVCAVRHEKPHHGVAHEFFQPSGPFAILPLADSHCSSLVWTARAELAEAYRRLDDHTYLEEIRRRFGSFLGELHLEGGRWVYPLGTTLADQFVAERLALIGDAARGMHPIAGQGVNYGFRDAATLAEELGLAAQRGEDLGAIDVLQRYQRRRRPDSVAILMATDALNRLFSNNITPIKWARRLGLAAFDTIGPLRRCAMRMAAGNVSYLPKSMQ